LNYVTESSLSKELLAEWLDIVETDYFMSGLFELLNESFSNFCDLLEQ